SLKAVLEGLPDAIALLGPDERVHMANPAFLNLVDMPEGDVLERPITEVLNLPEVSRVLESARAERQLKAEVFYDDERQKHFRVMVCPIEMSSKESPMVLLLHDISETKRTEQIRRDFVANVSHELKTPIATIKGYAETLLEGALEEPETLREFLGTILSYSKRMENLVNDLLQLTKIESGVIEMKKSTISLKETLNEICKGFSARASEKGLSLLCEVVPQDLTIEADPVRFSQIMHNLIDNAVKFTDEGFVMVKAEHKDNHVTVEVTDTGPGIPRWALPRLGERFFRVDPSRSRALGGTGLGLAIVKHLVQAHNWRIEFDSTPGKGTTARIVIPQI
ncbi:MAG: PAS domain-containing protein, partial [Nitrospirae bacterium]